MFGGKAPGLRRFDSTESTDPKPPPKERLHKEKATNFANKAHSKIKEARAMDTDAKMCTKKIEDEKKKPADKATLCLRLLEPFHPRHPKSLNMLMILHLYITLNYN